jgi:hypothetical protein
MMVKKLAISPTSPISASSSAAVPSPKTPLKPSNRGVAEVPMLAAPPSTPVLSTSVSAPVMTSVVRPQIVARGTSRLGSWDSSAAKGSSSIARKNQMAKGIAGKIPPSPCGRKLELPASGLMLVNRLASNFPEAITEMKKKPRIPSARMLMTTVNRMVASMPTMLIHTNTT